eukprot:TRINITY_DN17021_c0_g1_i1.p1 TRINITY_DN17021_c0_g1~~TRINITY_DN17021_c0_g1_i1.p1  ORF type:complete len:95 (-),score=9.40 TRINITY_DN17021_c0_g1_i1:296-580(-)
MDQSQSNLAHSNKVRSWTIKDVGLWLDSVELHGYKELFETKMIDGETLLDLDRDSIKDLVPSFHVKKVMRQIQVLQAKGNNSALDEIELLQLTN